MKIRLLTMWNGIAAGTVLEPGAGVAELLLLRKVAEEVKEQDLDGDGKSEGGFFGTRKAFTAPPAGKSQQQGKRR